MLLFWEKIVVVVLIILGTGSLAVAESASDLLTDDFDRLAITGETFQKDPFIPSPSSLDDIFVGDLDLKGILYSQEKSPSFALINETFIRVGDHLSGYTVHQILPDRVVLKNETGLFVLRFKAKKAGAGNE